MRTYSLSRLVGLLCSAAAACAQPICGAEPSCPNNTSVYASRGACTATEDRCVEAQGCSGSFWCGPDGSATQELGLRVSANEGVLSIDVDESRHLFHAGCSDQPELHSGPGASERYRDERRYDERGSGYYLDGEFLTIPLEYTCARCQPIVDVELPLRSIVWEGSRSPPPGVDLPGQPAEIPNFVSRPYSGPLVLMLWYQRDSDCSSPASTAVVALVAE